MLSLAGRQAGFGMLHDKQAVGAVLREFRAPNNRRGLVLLALDLSAYVACFLAVCLAPHWALKLPLSILLGICIGRMFQLGHTASHGALIADGNRRWRRPLAIFCFLPALTPEHAWDIGHNRVHHVCLNQKELDNTWVPMSPDEYRAASAGRRLWERVIRSLPGLGLYYTVDTWFREMICGSLRRLDKPALRNDLLLLAGFLIIEIALAVSLGASPWLNLLFAILLPQLVWHYIMAMVIYFHHTHEAARWYQVDSAARPSLLETAYEASRNVTLPWRIDALMHSVMVHVVHHLSPLVPCYLQAEATHALGERAGLGVTTHPIGWRRAWQITRHCQLYDFQAGCWRRFAEVTRTAPEG